MLDSMIVMRSAKKLMRLSGCPGVRRFQKRGLGWGRDVKRIIVGPLAGYRPLSKLLGAVPAVYPAFSRLEIFPIQCMLICVRVVERLALPTSDHGVADSNSAGGQILPEINSASLHRPFHVHPSIVPICLKYC